MRVLVLGGTGFVGRHVVRRPSSRGAERILGWHPTEPADAIRRSVGWHLAHPPADPDPGFTADTTALAAASPRPNA